MKGLVILGCVALIGYVSSHQEVRIPAYLQSHGYSILYKLLNDVGLLTAFKGDGPFTIFAPTDAAFNKLDANYLMSLSNNNQQLIKVLNYHVVSGFILKLLVTGTEVKTTLEGQEMNITRDANGTLVVNGVAKVISPGMDKGDITLINGAVQPIDTVLIPPVMGTETIASLLVQQDGAFQDTLMGLLLSNLLPVLEVGDFTFFAPTDIAWAPLMDRFLHPSHNPNATLYFEEILKYHIVPGGRTYKQLYDGQKLTTLHGTSINITKDAVTGMVSLDNRAHVLTADIPASNGVLYEIDHLILPSDFLAYIAKVVASRGTTTPSTV